MPATPTNNRIEKLIITLESRVRKLLTNNDIEEMTPYEREQCAAKYAMLILRLIELQQHTEPSDKEPSGNDLIAHIIGLKTQENKP